jgi:uncharacterized protein DUF6527
MRVDSIEYDFVELMPKKLREGVLYISIEYATAVHLCFCGCQSRVVTPLSPAQWSVTFNGETVSLSPSVGNHDLECASHYWIRKNQVRWSRPWSGEEIAKGRAADRRALAAHFDGKWKDGKVGEPPDVALSSIDSQGASQLKGTRS